MTERYCVDISGRDITPNYVNLQARTSVVRGVSEMQRMIDRQQRGMYPQEKSPLEQFDRAAEEWRELFHETVQYNGSSEARDKLSGEIADVWISTMGIATVAAVNMGPVVAHALSSMADKYDIRELAKLRAEGMSQDEAVAYRKSMWNGQK